jgi:hypothetical protein
MTRTHRKIALALALVALAAAAPAAPASAARDRSAGRETKLQRGLNQVVAAGVPGAVLLVREGRRTIRFTSGHGNLKPTTPMRARDRFRVGSITKPFVATVVLQLVGEHKLTLADTVERWLPALVPDGERISVRQLLNHTSGLFAFGGDRDQLLRPWADRRSRDGKLARRRASPPDLRGPAPARHEPSHRARHRRTSRARVLPPCARGRDRRQPVGAVGRRRARLQRRRPRPLLPRPARRTPHSPRPHAAHEDDGGGPPARAPEPLRARAAEAPQVLRGAVGAHRAAAPGIRPTHSTARRAGARSSFSSTRPVRSRPPDSSASQRGPRGLSTA